MYNINKQAQRAKQEDNSDTRNPRKAGPLPPGRYRHRKPADGLAKHALGVLCQTQEKQNQTGEKAMRSLPELCQDIVQIVNDEGYMLPKDEIEELGDVLEVLSLELFFHANPSALEL